MSNFEPNRTNAVPYIAFEGVQIRLERTNRRLWILCIILIVVLLGTNAGWLWYESQFEYYEITQEAEADGDSDINLQGVGDNYYGRESEADY